MFRKGLHPSIPMLVAVLVGVFHVSTLRSGHDWGDDFSMYVRHAQNLALGLPYAETGYIYNPHNPTVGPRLYPPGFPVLLAPVVTVFGLDLKPMKVLVVAFFAGALLASALLFGSALSPGYSLALVSLVGLNPYFWEFKDQILSDLPFLFFALLSLWLFARSDEPGSIRRRITLGVLTGLAAYAAYATRVLAVALIPCFLAHDLVRYRTVRMHVGLAVSILVLLGGSQYVLWVHDSSYLDQWSVTPRGVWGNLVAYLQSLSTLWENGYSDGLRKAGFLVTGALATLGFAGPLGARTGSPALFPVFYVVPVLLWPSFQDTRFLIPIVPFVFYFALLGVRRLDTITQGRTGRKHLVLSVFLVATAGTYAARYSTITYEPMAEGVEKRESIEFFEFVRTSTAPDDVFVFRKPRALALFTGRRSTAPFYPADSCQLWSYVGEIRAAYLVTGPGTEDPGDTYLRALVTRFPDHLRPVMENRDLSVYRVAGNPCAARPGG